MSTEYLLMNKDKKILTFRAETNEYQEVLLEQEDVETLGLPLGFRDIQSFIEHRQAPKHRAHIWQLLVQMGCDNLIGFMDVSHALSLNDTYWVKRADSTLVWEDVSLYQNDFDTMIAQMAFEGGTSRPEFSSTSPEYVTDGSYAKCWIRDRGEIQLIKTGFHHVGLEPFSEFYASQLAAILCHQSVSYKIERYHDRVVSRCPLFTNEQEGYLPAMKVIEERQHKNISYLLPMFEKIGAEDDFRRMIVLDALIVNIDRHAGNYGFIVDNDTQQIKRMAPVFDHNRSLLYSLPEEQLKIAEDYIRIQTPRIGGEFNTAAHFVLTPDIKEELLNLKGFRFQRDGTLDLSEQRLTILEELVNRQIDHILERKSIYFYKSTTLGK